MIDPRVASREKFLTQLAACVLHQNPDIILPAPLRAIDEMYGVQQGEFIPQEPMGNGEHVVTDVDHASQICDQGGWA
jgi:hypothetical protein